jgi:hypothetical protein
MRTRPRPRRWPAGCAVLVAALAGAGPGPAHAAGDLDAVVLEGARSPALQALRSVTGLDTTRRSRVRRLDARRYDMVVVDGDRLTAGELRRRPALDDFLAAGRWIAAVDMAPRDLDALRTYTGFDVADGRGDRSELFAFRVARVRGTPTVEMIDSGPYAQPGTGRLGDRRRAAIRRDHVRRVARIVEREVGRDGAAAKVKERPSCPPLDPPASPELQHVDFCYVDAGEAPLPGGYWTEKANPYWVEWASSSHQPGRQTATWTMTHRFDVFLDNSSRSGANGAQTVYYRLNGQFAPKRDDEDFFRSDRRADKITNGQGIFPERAWWTAMIEPRVIPKPATRDKLDWKAGDPRNANQETSYSSSEEFSVGFNASGAAGNLQNVANGGGGFSISYTTGKSKTQSIPDWGVENRGTGPDLRWRFSARHPCDARSTPAAVGDRAFQKSCFAAPTSGAISYDQPAKPPALSLGQNQVEASGRWETTKNLDGADGALTFTLATPVTLYDTFCVPYLFDSAFLVHDPCFVKRLREATLGEPDDVTINAGIVNPVPIKDVKLAPNPADGGKREKVTGTIELERKAQIPVTVRIFSNKGNADVGTPVGSDVTQDTVTIDPGQSTGTFTVLTNDNGLDKDHPHVTATISAFYTRPVRTQLTIDR